MTSLGVEVDPVRLTQVLINLLTNAAKYTPAGGLITIEHRFEAHRLLLSARDNGLGLAPEMLTRVFTMFTQVESQITRAEGGLGAPDSLNGNQRCAARRSGTRW